MKFLENSVSEDAHGLFWLATLREGLLVGTRALRALRILDLIVHLAAAFQTRLCLTPLHFHPPFRLEARGLPLAQLLERFPTLR